MTAVHRRKYESIPSERSSVEVDEEYLREGVALVRRLAFRMVRRLPSNVEVDDLIGAGMEGLLKAIHSFDESRGTRFDAYAKTRVRGAILDELRANDVMTRHGRARLSEVSNAIARLQQSYGRDPSDEEVAEALSMSLGTYQRLTEELGQGPLLAGLGAVAPDEVAGEQRDPSLEYEDSEARALLADAIVGLPRRNQEVLALYYQEDCTQAEVAAILGVSESRVCQLLGETNARLRTKLGRRGLHSAQAEAR